MKAGDTVYKVRVSYGSLEFGEATVIKATTKQVVIKAVNQSPFGWRHQFPASEVFETPRAAWEAALVKIRYEKQLVEGLLQRWRSAEGTAESAILREMNHDPSR